MQIAAMTAYRQPEIVTQRPYGFDIDEAGWLWEGQRNNLLYCHNIHTAEARTVPLGLTRGSGACDVACFGGMLVVTVQNGAEYLVYDPVAQVTHARPIPGEDPHVWYTQKLPDGRLVLFERHYNRLLLLTEPLGEPLVIDCPYTGNIAGGRVGHDGLLYMSVINPARLIRFDPARNQFVDEIPCPRTDASLGGCIFHDGMLYSADSPRGVFYSLNVQTGVWQEPIPVPGYGEVFGFIGGSASHQGKGYFALSTYRYPSRIDPATGKIITVDPATGEAVSPEIAAIGCDGKPHRFIGRQLVFDPAAQAFDFLDAPAQPDGEPLLCYNLSTPAGLYMTGYVIPHAAPGEASRHPGDWLILQSHPAADEPGYERYDFSFNKKAHVDATRLCGPRSQSLYIPCGEITPAIQNAAGSVSRYPVGREQRILRRVARTDRKRFLQSILDRILQPGDEDAVRTRAILSFVNGATYYSPIHELDIGHNDPVALLACHDIRCGGAATTVQALCELAGIECRRVNLHHHVVAEAFFDGAWHACDALFFGANLPLRDGVWLGVEALKATPYFADAISQDCFVFPDDCMRSCDGYYMLGYQFGVWGWEPYYSYYLGAVKDTPPTLAVPLPLRRLENGKVQLRWTESLKRGGGEVEYAVGIYQDRDQTDAVFTATTRETQLVWQVPEERRMYFIGIQAMDAHRRFNPQTWYPTTRSNFVLASEDTYGWFNVF